MHSLWCFTFLVAFFPGGSNGEAKEGRTDVLESTKQLLNRTEVIKRGKLKWSKKIALRVHELIALKKEVVVMKFDRKCYFRKFVTSVKNISYSDEFSKALYVDLFIEDTKATLEEAKLEHTGLYRFFCSVPPSEYPPPEYLFYLKVYENNTMVSKPAVKWISKSKLRPNEAGLLTCKVTKGYPPPFLEVELPQVRSLKPDDKRQKVSAFDKNFTRIMKTGYGSISIYFDRFSIKSNTGTYACKAQNHLGTTYKQARITAYRRYYRIIEIIGKTIGDNKDIAIEDASDQKHYLVNNIKIDPSSAVIKIGGRHLIRLKVPTELLEEKIVATWFRIDKTNCIMPLPHRARQLGNNLLIEQATMEMNSYFIVFVIIIGKPMVSLTTKVTVQEPLVIRDYWAFNGERVAMKFDEDNCKLLQIQSKYSWKPTIRDVKIIRNTGIIKRAKLYYSGIYSFSCFRHSYAEPLREYKFNLIVIKWANFEKPIVRWIHNPKLVDGRNESIVCQAIQGNPIPEVSIIRTGQYPTDFDVNVNFHEHLRQSSAIINLRFQPFVLTKDMAKYECIGENRLGRDTEIIELKLDKSTYTSREITATVTRERTHVHETEEPTAQRKLKIKLVPSVLHLRNGDKGRITIEFQENGDENVITIWKMRDIALNRQPLPMGMHQTDADLVIDCATEEMNGNFEANILSIGQPTIRLTATVVVQPLYKIQNIESKLSEPITMSYNFCGCEDFKINHTGLNVTGVKEDDDILLTSDKAMIKQSNRWNSGMYTFFCNQPDRPYKHLRVYIFNVVFEEFLKPGDEIPRYQPIKINLSNGDSKTISPPFILSSCKTNIKVNWRQKSHLDTLLPLPRGMQQNQTNLQIDYATDEMNGEFVCKFICFGRSIQNWMVIINVNNTFKREWIRVNVHDKVELRYNERGCSVGGWFPSVHNITVNFDGTESNIDLMPQGNGKAIIKRAELWHAGIYEFRCFMHKASEASSRIFQFMVEVGKRRLEKPVVSTVFKESYVPGLDSEVYCKLLKGYPPPEIKLFRNETLSPYSNLTTRHRTRAKYFYINHFDIAKHSGHYTCIAVNEIGSDVKTFKIGVTKNTLPTIFVRNYDGRNVENNGTYTSTHIDRVACFVSSFPPSLIKWYYRPFSHKGRSAQWTELTTSVRKINDYVVELQSLAEIGHYRCTAEYQNKSFGIAFRRPKYMKMQLKNLKSKESTVMDDLSSRMVLNLTSRQTHVQIKCIVDAFPKPKFVRWRQCFDLKFCYTYTSHYFTKNLLLNLTSITDRDHQFRCQSDRTLSLENQEATINTIYKEVIINILEAPNITNPEMKELWIYKKKVPEEEIFYNLELQCTVSSHYPDSTHSWTKDGGEIPSVAKITYEYSYPTLDGYRYGDYFATLKIKPYHLASNLSGIYEFRIQNSVGSDSRKFHVEIGKEYPLRYKVFKLKREHTLSAVLPLLHVRPTATRNQGYDLGTSKSYHPKALCSADSLLPLIYVRWMWRSTDLRVRFDFEAEPWRIVPDNLRQRIDSNTERVIVNTPNMFYKCEARNELGTANSILKSNAGNENRIHFSITSHRKYGEQSDELNLTCRARDGGNGRRLSDVKYSWEIENGDTNFPVNHTSDGSKLYIKGIRPHTSTKIACKIDGDTFQASKWFIIFGKKDNIDIVLDIPPIPYHHPNHLVTYFFDGHANVTFTCIARDRNTNLQLIDVQYKWMVEEYDPTFYDRRQDGNKLYTYLLQPYETAKAGCLAVKGHNNASRWFYIGVKNVPGYMFGGKKISGTA